MNTAARNTNTCPFVITSGKTSLVVVGLLLGVGLTFLSRHAETIAEAVSLVFVPEPIEIEISSKEAEKMHIEEPIFRAQAARFPLDR